MATWLTRDALKAEWRDGQHATNARLDRLLEVAKDQLLQHAPQPLPDDIDTNPPAAYVEAQLLQVQAIWAESKTNASSDGTTGIEGFQITRSGPYQLGPGIMRLLRPFPDRIG